MKIKFVDLEQGSQEWKDFRKGKIGSSMAAAIVGKGFKTPLELFEDIMEDKETVVNEAMLRGTLMEPEARKWLNDKYGSDLKPCVVTHPDPAFDWHISSLDGLYVEPDGSIFVCEIKCPGKVDHEMALSGTIPEKYLPQLYHIFEDLPGVDRILYFSYHPDSQAKIWIDRREADIKQQFKAEMGFYERILNCNPPEPTEKDWIDIRDEKIISKAKHYQMLKDTIADFEEQARLAKEDLVNDLGDLKRVKMGNIKAQRTERKGSPQYTKIPELKGVNLDLYRGETIVSWRIT